MKAPLALALAAVVCLVATPALAGGRAKTNAAWIETVELAHGVRQAPQATPAELAELDRRMSALAAEQRRLMDEAVWLDGEEAWLVGEAQALRELKERFQQACSEITDDNQLASCQDLAGRYNARVDPYNDRYLRFSVRNDRYGTAVRAWLADLEAMRAWMRPILSRRGLAAAERAQLERERAKLRADVDGIQEALRRLEQGHQASEADRADWEVRYEDAAARARERLKEYLADQSIEVAQALFEKCSERLTKEIRAKIDERINWAGGTAPDKAERVKALDGEIAGLISSRADVDSAGPALSRAIAALRHGFTALESGSLDDREKALGEMRDVVGDALADPAVQRALRISEAPATVFTYAKLISESSFDITTELLAIVRLRGANQGSEQYLEDVRRLDEQMKKKVARLQEIGRLLDAK